MIIMEVRLRRKFNQDIVGGEKITAKTQRYWLKQMVKFSNPRLDRNVWIRSSTNNCKICDGGRGE